MSLRVAILGASGYSGAELLRYLSLRRAISGDVEIAAVTASQRAGASVASVLPQFRQSAGSSLFADLPNGLPKFSRWQDVDWQSIDIAFCALPHGTTQEVITELWRYSSLRIIDLSADFRLSSFADYEHWYGKAHGAPQLQGEAVYGLSEHFRASIGKARLVANPGCYATAAQLALLPLAPLIDCSSISIDAKSGVTGAGRSLREEFLYCEINEDFRAYSLSGHRHVAEIEQGLELALGSSASSDSASSSASSSSSDQPRLRVSFVPHLVPMDRGILTTSYLRLRAGESVSSCLAAYDNSYSGSAFIEICRDGSVPSVKLLRGTNRCSLAIFADRRPGWIVVFSAIDNLGKGAAGMALQNMNLMLGLEEDYGFADTALVP